MDNSTSAPPGSESPAPSPKDNWKYQNLDLEEVLEDSPISRERMKVMEEDIEDISNKLKKIVKTTRQIQSVSTNLSQLYKQFGDEMLAFSKSIDDSKIRAGFVKFADSMKEVENFRDLLSIQMENLISLPIENFVKREIEDVKEKHKKYDRVNSQHNSALSKLSSLKKKEPNPLKTLETEHELNDAKRDFRIGTLDFAFSLNDTQAKKNYEFLESSVAFTFAQYTYFHQGYEMCNELSTYMTELTAYIQQEKKKYNEERAQVLAHKKMLENQPTTSVIYAQRKNSTTKSSAKTIQGYLFKRNTSTISNIRNEWQRRYFIVSDGVINYYKNSKDMTDATAINLLLCSVKERNDIDRRFCFELISPDKSFLLQAESEEKMREWISVLQNATADALNSQNLNKKSDNNSKTNTSSPSQPHSNNPSQGGSAIEQIRAVNPMNKICADCGEKDPDWVAINLGVFVCIECSGFHRSMGVHISKVRSLTLDKLEPELVKLMFSLGNENANRILEYDIPSDIKKPSHDCDKVTREKWIRMKYQEKKFVKKTTLSKDQLNKQLYAAAKEGKLLTLFEVLVQGADINYENVEEGKRTSLHITANVGNFLCLAFLLQNRPNLNALDVNLWTPLHCAAANGRTNIACYLFKNGAKLDIKNSAGQTPLDLAIANQQVHCVTLLRLAQLALLEANGSSDDSFMEALKDFSIDAEFEK